MSKPLVIFDFDGTIADTFPQFFLTINHELEKLGRTRITNPAPYRAMNTREVIAKLQVPWYALPFIIRRARVVLRAALPSARVHTGMAQALRALHKTHTIGVVTSNDAVTVRSYLEKHAIPFDHFIGNVGLFGKARALKRMAACAEHVVGYVGDETRDIEAAHKAGMRAIAVSWGYNTPAILKKFKPDVFVTNAKQLQKLK